MLASTKTHSGKYSRIVAFLCLCIVGLFAAFIATTPAHSNGADNPDCRTLEEGKEVIGRQAPQALVTAYETAEAAGILREYNELPPQTGVEADQLLVVFQKTRGVAHIFFFNAGCLIGKATNLKPNLVRKLLNNGLTNA